MANSLSPAFVKINYASSWGAHVMTVPTVPLQVDGSIPIGYRFTLRGSALPVPVNTAIEDYVDILRPLFPSTVIFSDAVVFSQPTPSDVPVPVATVPLGVAGTSVVVSWTKAVQNTFTFRADDFSIFKVVALDAVSYNIFDRNVDPDGRTEWRGLIDYVTDDVTFVAARGGGRPDVFLQNSLTLNEKLRRAYNMT